MPTETPETAHIWEGYRREQIALQSCNACGHRRFLPAYRCPDCGSTSFTIVASTGLGSVFSFAITHRPEGLPVVDEFPVIALIELDEGVRLVSNVVGVPPDAVFIGQRVEAYFETLAPEVSLVRFRAVAAA